MASVGFAALCAPTASSAQAATAPTAAADSGEIIVTARRSDEKLQNVPENVQAISGSQLQKLSITSVEELSKLAPGLTLVNAGTSTQVTLRGVAWRPGSGTPATPIYFNEVPFDPGQTVQSLFDIGQIEVLRGPQGTSRGAPSISGAITVTTKKPNLNEFGGYVQGLYGEADHGDVQGAINVPIIKGILAVRLAGNVENSRGNQVFSVHSAIKPSIKDRTFRATVLFQPTHNLSIEAMYQRRRTDRVQYDQVTGTGSPGYAGSPVAFLGALGAIPANFNGPALTVGQRASVEDAGNITHDKLDLFTINANWHILGHIVSANYGHQYNLGKSGDSLNAADPLNILPGYEPFTSPTNVGGVPGFHTYELRVSSEPNADRPFDYDIGWFSKHSQGLINNTSPAYLAGAFGGPAALPGSVTTPNPAYILPVNSIIGIGQYFDSFYGDVKFHIDRNTELTGGLAIVRDRVPVSLDVTVGSALNNIGNLNVVKLGFPAVFRPLITSCFVVGAFAGANIVPSSAYPGTCDAVVAAGSGAPPPQATNAVYSKALYNFSLSHKFSDQIMVYATTGSSYRSGLPALGNVGLPGTLFLPQPEEAKSYELGIKTTFGRALHINASVFQLDYKGQLTSFQGVQYYDAVKGTIDTAGVAAYGNVDSRVRGFELEIAARPTKELSLGANLSYSSIKSQGGNIPCNKDQTVAANTLSATNPINICASPVGQVLNQDAPFQATVNGNYTLPLGGLAGYVGFNLNFKGVNPNYTNFGTTVAGVTTFKPTPSYATLDLFAGVTGNKGAWELGAYAKNVFDKQVELSRVTPTNNIYGPYAVAPGGYDQVTVSAPREIGVKLRVAFGSR
jgi:iron complex outermembrane receptor protein